MTSIVHRAANRRVIVRALDTAGSIVDGPGLRSVLYFQGCHRRCVGCHNPETWDPRLGRWVEVNALAAELRCRVRNKKLTISGGEPLQQSAGLLRLVEALPDFDIALYTSFELEDVHDEILQHLTYIKVGRYQRELRSTTIPYVGSRNQKMIKLREPK